jgi:DNA repair protein RadC
LIDLGSVFRTAVIADASYIVVMHNHPSGEASPSEADIQVTQALKRAGEIIRVEVLDHVIMGHPMFDKAKGYCSLRELGYLSAQCEAADRRAA